MATYADNVTRIFIGAGQSQEVNFRSNPASLPDSDIDANIPFNSNGGAGFTPLATDITYLRPQLIADGGGNGFTDTVTAPGTTIPAGYSSHGYGAEMMIGRNQYSADRPVAYVKRSTGGTALGNAGSNPYYHNYQDPTLSQGFNVSDLIDRVEGMQAHITSGGRTPVIAGLYYMQGEDDASDLTAAGEYGYHLSRLIHGLRAYFQTEFPVVLGLTTTFGTADGRDLVNKGKIEVAQSLRNVRLYDPTPDNLPQYTDGHFWQDAAITIGNRVSAIYDEMGV